MRHSRWFSYVFSSYVQQLSNYCNERTGSVQSRRCCGLTGDPVNWRLFSPTCPLLSWLRRPFEYRIENIAVLVNAAWFNLVTVSNLPTYKQCGIHEERYRFLFSTAFCNYNDEHGWFKVAS